MTHHENKQISKQRQQRQKPLKHTEVAENLLEFRKVGQLDQTTEKNSDDLSRELSKVLWSFL